MILDRLYNPAHGELVYHYCRPEAFLEIIRNRSIWLSSSYSLNDTTERSWGYSMFINAAKTLQREIGDEFTKKILPPIMASRLGSIIMIGCFSLDPELLSQWRAYGDESRGF